MSGGFRQRLFGAQMVGKLLGVETSDLLIPPFSRRYPYEHIMYLPKMMTSYGMLRRIMKTLLQNPDDGMFDGCECALREGYYGVITPINDSPFKSDDEQGGFIKACYEGYRRTPMVLDVLSLGVSIQSGNCILHRGDSIRCLERTAQGSIGLSCDNGRILVADVPRDSSPQVYASACRYIAPVS